MFSNMFLFIFLAGYFGALNAQGSDCKNQGPCGFSVDVDGKDYFIVPNPDNNELVTVDDESKKVVWNFFVCDSNDAIVMQNPKDKSIISLKGGCGGSQLVLDPEGDFQAKSSQITLGPMSICDKCLYRSKDGKIMAADDCENKDNKIYFSF